jgi:HAE1 family hydrophobic/amphiphilic exporter-1
MSGIINAVLKRRAVVVLITLLVMALGLFSVTQLQSELLPNVEFPYLTISTAYPGASADQVAKQVSQPVEAQVSSLAGLKTVRSISNDSFSFIIAEFDYGTNIKELETELNNNLRNVALPTGLNGSPVQPTVGTINFNSQAVVTLGINSKSGTDDTASLEKLGRIANEQIKPALSNLPGVSSVQVVGDSVKLITLTFDPAKLNAAHITTTDINNALKNNNVSFPDGAANVNGLNVPVRTAYTFTDLDQIKNLPIVPTTAAGAAPTTLTAPVKLGDVVAVQEINSNANGISRTDGKPGVVIQVYKTQNGNTITVSDSVNNKINDLKSQLTDINVNNIYDQAPQIKSSVDGLVREGLLGALFAVLVIFFFLRSVRSTLVTAISIPTSVVVAFILLYWQGITLNIMTLGGLAIAVGRVIDDAIVVLENIFRHVQDGDPVPVAVRLGTREVASAVTSSTITTVAVFLPLGFVGGITGTFFLPFALTVTFALLASLVVALFIIPTFASFFITVKSVGKHKDDTLLQKTYTPILKWSLRHRLLTLLIAFLLFVGSIALAVATNIPLAFLANSGDKFLQTSITLAPGSDAATVLKIAEQAEQILATEPEVQQRQTTISGNGLFGRSQRAFGAGGGDANILVKLDPKADENGVASSLREKMKAITPTGGNIAVSVLGGFSSSALSIIVQGPDADKVRQGSDMVLKSVADVPDLANLRSDVSAVVPQIVVSPSPTKTGGRVNTLIIGAQLRSLLQGQTISTVQFQDGQPRDIIIQANPLQGQNLDDYIKNLKSLPIFGAITLDQVADVTVQQAPVQVTRIDQQLAANITADITTDDTGGVSRTIMLKLNNVQLPAGVTYSLAGATQQQSSAFAGLLVAMGVAVALVYIVMVLVFGSLLEPFAILFSLPLALIGALGGLIVTHRALGLPAMIGLLMLIGIVVTNAIVLVDLVNQLRKQGHELKEALITAGRNRVRPILMTAVATILALMPLALGFSEGSIIAAELGTVVIGGLLTSTLLTLVVVPVVYSLLEGLKGRIYRRFGRQSHKNDPSDHDHDSSGKLPEGAELVVAPAVEGGIADGGEHTPVQI